MAPPCTYGGIDGVAGAAVGLGVLVGASEQGMGVPLPVGVPMAFLKAWAESRASGNQIYSLGVCKHLRALFKPIR